MRSGEARLATRLPFGLGVQTRHGSDAAPFPLSLGRTNTVVGTWRGASRVKVTRAELYEPRGGRARDLPEGVLPPTVRDAAELDARRRPQRAPAPSTMQYRSVRFVIDTGISISRVSKPLRFGRDGEVFSRQPRSPRRARLNFQDRPKPRHFVSTTLRIQRNSSNRSTVVGRWRARVKMPS